MTTCFLQVGSRGVEQLAQKPKDCVWKPGGDPRIRASSSSPGPPAPHTRIELSLTTWTLPCNMGENPKIQKNCRTEQPRGIGEICISRRKEGITFLGKQNRIITAL